MKLYWFKNKKKTCEIPLDITIKHKDFLSDVIGSTLTRNLYVLYAFYFLSYFIITHLIANANWHMETIIICMLESKIKYTCHLKLLILITIVQLIEYFYNLNLKHYYGVFFENHTMHRNKAFTTRPSLLWKPHLCHGCHGLIWGMFICEWSYLSKQSGNGYGKSWKITW